MGNGGNNENYMDVLRKRQELEKNIENFIKKWKNNEFDCDYSMTRQILEKSYEQLSILKKKEKSLYDKYMRSDAKPDNDLHHNTSLKKDVDMEPSEPLEQEKAQLLNAINRKVSRKEISLEQASKLFKEVNNSYDFYLKEKTIKTEKNNYFKPLISKQRNIKEKVICKLR